MIGIGVSLTPPTIGRRYLAASEGLFARMDTIPDLTRRLLINDTIKSYQNSGFWQISDCIHHPAAHSEVTAKLNWKPSPAYNLVAVATPTWVQDRYIESVSATTSYFRTNFIPISAAGRYSPDDASFGFLSLLNLQSDNIVMGARTTNGSAQALITARNTSNQIVSRVNQAGGSNFANTDGSGHFVARRTAAAVSQVFRNDVSLGTSAVTSTSRPARDFFIGACNTGGVPDTVVDQRFAFAHVGAAMSDSMIAAVRVTATAYLTSIGAL